jgi:hypothetical protein
LHFNIYFRLPIQDTEHTQRYVFTERPTVLFNYASRGIEKKNMKKEESEEENDRLMIIIKRK